MSEEWSEEWLYGESANDGLSKPEDSGVEGEVEKKVLPQEVVENQESSSSKQNEDGDKEEVGNGDADGASREEKEPAEDGTEDRNEDESEDEDDDDSDDDGVQVTIGDIKAEPLTAQAAAFGPKQRAAGPPPDKKGKFAVEDFEATGTINGVPAQDFSLDSLEEKPWRKPGADITDYFNYGFTEETWRAYCDRQKRLRHEAGGSMPQSDRERKHHTGSTNIPIIGSDNSKYGQQQNIIFPKKFGSMDRQKDPQRIPRAREEPRENTIQVMTADRREYSRKSFDMPPQMGPPPPFDMSMPPPTYGHPPPDVYGGPPPPEFFGHPPPPFFPGDGPPHPLPHQMGPNPHGMMHHHPPPHHAPMDYEEQQWMDSSWESNMNRPPMQSVNSTVVPVMKVNLPPPPGESDDLDKDKDKS